MRLISAVALGLSGLMGVAAAAAPGPWEQPAVALAGQIADMLGPGQAHLTIRNLSSLSNDQIPAIRQLLIQDLQARGVVAAGADSANAIRVTLSESAQERLWVAEVVEGDDTQVAMVDVGPVSEPQTQAAAGLTLRRQQILTAHTPILAALETPGGLVALEPEQIAIYAQAADGWHETQRFGIGQTRPLPRDPRGVLLSAANGAGFDAWLAGTECTGSDATAGTQGGWTVDCHRSDDPWRISGPIGGANGAVTAEGTLTAGPQMQTAPAPTQMQSAQASVPPLRAFYNAARDYFTGIIVPSPSMDLPPFYSAVLLPRAGGGEALLIGGIDGKVQLLENGALTSIDGARDWGSDFAALRSGCGAGTQIDAQIIASGSGEAVSDSLRAYDLPALEAVPASAPLAMNGTVMALWTAPDGKSVLAVVRDAQDQYEVDRVTASCN